MPSREMKETMVADLDPQAARDLASERAQIIGGINDTINTLPIGSDVRLRHVGTRDGRDLGVTVRSRHAYQRHAQKTYHKSDFNVSLDITGTTSDQDGQESPEFPLYRVTRVVPGTDTGYLAPHFEVAVAEGDDFRPIALVMQSVLGSPESRIYQGSPKVAPGYSELFRDGREHLSPEAEAELSETGLFVDPGAQAQLDEVRTILELAVIQDQAAPGQDMLPFDYTAAA